MRLVVLASGNGSNLQTILDNITAGMLKAEIVAVISDKENAFALQRAQKVGIPTVYVNSKLYPNREEFNTAIADTVQTYSPDYIVLAGYMRILTPAFVQRFPMRILNIHPSLLPAFQGLHAQQQAWEYGVKVSGCTVHFVDSGLDSGPIIAQRTVEVLDTDTEADLSARILQQEHLLYTQVLSWLTEGKIKIDGRKVFIKKG